MGYHQAMATASNLATLVLQYTTTCPTQHRDAIFLQYQSLLDCRPWVNVIVIVGIQCQEPLEQEAVVGLVLTLLL